MAINNGYLFMLSIDRAVESAFVRWAVRRRKPDRLFGLIQMLYDDCIHPDLGPAGGVALFGTLFAWILELATDLPARTLGE